jgi:hypothetical protein
MAAWKLLCSNPVLMNGWNHHREAKKGRLKKGQKMHRKRTF